MTLSDPRVIPKDIREGIVTGLAGRKRLDFHKQFYATIAGPDAKVKARVLADCERVAQKARFGKAFAQWNPEAAWTGPIFILSSEASDNPAALYRLAPAIPYDVVKGTGHWLQRDAPDIVAKAIRRFIAGIENK